MTLGPRPPQLSIRPGIAPAFGSGIKRSTLAKSRRIGFHTNGAWLYAPGVWGVAPVKLQRLRGGVPVVSRGVNRGFVEPFGATAFLTVKDRITSLVDAVDILRHRAIVAS
eukprot:865892-Pyramimonas_sp.AAC.4